MRLLRLSLAHRHVPLLFLIPLAVALVASPASAIDIDWLPSGGGSWNTPANWSGAEVPDASGEAAVVDSTVGGGTITLDINPSLDSILIENPLNTFDITGRTLTLLQVGGLFTNGFIQGGSVSTIVGNITTTTSGGANLPAGNTFVVSGNGTLTNDGTWNINSDSSASNVLFRANQPLTITGGGEFVLRTGGSPTDATITSLTTTAIITHEAGHTIRGTGTISGTVVNNGTIDADASGETLDLNAQTKTNNGTLRASNGGILDIGVSVTQGASGVIVGDNGTVAITGGTITGGILNSMNGGRVANTGSAHTLNAVRNDGTFDVEAGKVTVITGGSLENNGIISVNPLGLGPNTTLRFDAATDLTGSGEIVLATADNPIDAIISSLVLGAVITQAPTHTIRGEGRIAGVLTNNGLVEADVSGRTLELTSNTMGNNATFRATGGGTLDISTSINQGVAGVIEADNGTVTFTGGTVTGGRLNSVNGGLLSAPSGTTVLSAVRNDGDFLMADGITTIIKGGSFENNGTLTVNDGGSGNANLRFDVATDLSGTGEIVMQTAGTIVDATLSSLVLGAVVTHGATHTIRGEGQITAVLTNNGLVDADVAGRVLDLTANAKSNNGTLRATGGGILDISSVINQGPSGVIRADGGSVTLTGATINGGRLETNGGSVIAQTSGTAVLNQVQNDGEVEIAPGLLSLVTGGSLVNNGTITMLAGAANTVLRFDDPGVLGGTGALILQTAGTVSDATVSSLSLGDTLTNGSDHTIRGEGTINAVFVNEGAVSADVDDLTLLMSANAQVNNAVLEARMGGILSVTSPMLNNATVTAYDSASVTIPSGIFNNDGVLSADGGTVLVTSLSFNNTDGVAEARNGGLWRAGSLNQHYSVGTLTGGSWQVYENSAMRLIGANIVTNKAEIVLDGPGSNLYSDDATTEALANWTLNDIAGTFTIRNARDYSTLAAWSNSGCVMIGSNSTLTALGDYVQNKGKTTVLGTLTAATDTVCINEGLLEGTGTVDAHVKVGGFTSPGASIGVLTVDGNYSQDASAILIAELGGTDPSQVDLLDVTGTASLDGNVRVVLTNGFMPSVGDSFLVLSAGAISGAITEVLDSCPSPGVCLEAAIVGNDLYLVGVAPQVTGVGDEGGMPAQLAFAPQMLAGGRVQFALELPEAANVRIDVFDVRGRRIAELRNGFEPAGRHEVAWDGRSSAGQLAGSGVYFARAAVTDASGRTVVLNGKVVVAR